MQAHRRIRCESVRKDFGKYPNFFSDVQDMLPSNIEVGAKKTIGAGLPKKSGQMSFHPAVRDVRIQDATQNRSNSGFRPTPPQGAFPLEEG